MPNYLFRCSENHDTEQYAKIGTKLIVCPECQRFSYKVFIPTANIGINIRENFSVCYRERSLTHDESIHSNSIAQTIQENADKLKSEQKSLEQMTEQVKQERAQRESIGQKLTQTPDGYKFVKAGESHTPNWEKN